MKKLLARVPSRHAIAGSKWARPIAPLLRHDHIWRLDRRSVGRGVALGLFCGILIPIGQSFGAALVAAPLRANLAVAALATFITNPFTTPFFYLAGFELGSRVLHDRGARFTMPSGDTVVEMVASAWDWVLGASGPTLLGLLLIALALAAIGYAATEIGWRAWVAARWRARRRGRVVTIVG